MGKNKSKDCEIVQDLLPLYYDNVCSPSSREFVQTHLNSCEKCRKTFSNLENRSIDKIMEQETQNILARHAQKERTAAYTAGLVIAALLLIPIIITFWVSMASGGGFFVFSVVVPAMLLVASLTAIPLLTTRKRLMKSILLGSIALLLIIFFVDRGNGGGEFLLLSVPTIFGLSILFFPIVIRGLSLPPALSDQKALITMAWDTIWLFLTIFVVCYHSGDISGLRNGSTIAFILMTGAWIIFFITRYLPFNRWVKSGLISFVCGIWAAFSNDLYSLFCEHKHHLTLMSANFANWSSDTYINANSYLALFLICLFTGILLLTIGILKTHNAKKQEN